MIDVQDKRKKKKKHKKKQILKLGRCWKPPRRLFSFFSIMSFDPKFVVTWRLTGTPNKLLKDKYIPRRIIVNYSLEIVRSLTVK